MADSPQQQQQAAASPPPPASIKPPTWEEETSTFLTPAEKAAKKAAGNDDDGAARERENAGKSDDDAAAAAKIAGTDTAKAAAGEDTLKGAEGDQARKGEGGEKAAEKGSEEELPAWLKDRTARAAEKERKAGESVQQFQDRIAELEEENARLKATPPKAVVVPAEPVKPKSADFDTPEEYEAARDKYDTDKAAYETAKAEAAKAPAKVEEKKTIEPAKKAADAAPGLPLGITPDDITEAAKNIRNAAGTLADAISDEKKVPTFTAAMMMHVAEQPKERTKEMVEWVIASPKTMKAIAALPPIKQPGAFERAFSERPAAKKVSEAPKPTKRLSEGIEPGDDSFSSFEERRNAEEIAERAAGKF